VIKKHCSNYSTKNKTKTTLQKSSLLIKWIMQKYCDRVREVEMNTWNIHWVPSGFLEWSSNVIAKRTASWPPMSGERYEQLLTLCYTFKQNIREVSLGHRWGSSQAGFQDLEGITGWGVSQGEKADNHCCLSLLTHTYSLKQRIIVEGGTPVLFYINWFPFSHILSVPCSLPLGDLFQFVIID
jgi:hypothetical protein